MFTYWLDEKDLVPLPKNLHNSKTLRIKLDHGKRETYPIQDIATILADDKTPERTKLFILLMLNTGAYQVDIAHLLKSQVDLKQGRIERKRSKTENHANVPVVSYRLWSRTSDLMRKYITDKKTHLALLNEDGFRLPLARGRIVLLDKPCGDLESYLEWQVEPHYCSLDAALTAIFKVILPLPMESKDGKKEKKNKKIILEVGRVFGSLRGKYASVLVDFWLGHNNPPDSLNSAIMLTARMLPFYFNNQPDAVDYLEELIDGLPDASFSDRMVAGKRKAISSIVRQSVKTAYDGNGHQSDPQLSTKKLAKTFQAWTNRGFSLVDRSTWRNSGVVLGDDFSFSNKELEGIAYFSQILKVDVQTAADATRHLLRLLVGNPTGQMSVSYAKKLLVGFGVRCGHHGKVNEFLNALAQAGWIAQVAGYIPGRRGKLWQVGERMLKKFPSSITTNNPLSPSIFVSHFQSQQRTDGRSSLTLTNKPSLPSIFVSHSPFNKPSLRQKEEELNEIMKKSVVLATD